MLKRVVVERRSICDLIHFSDGGRKVMDLEQLFFFLRSDKRRLRPSP